MIVAFTGLKQSGKNTAGSYLVDAYGFKEYSFAKPIKEVCCFLFDWSLDYIEDHKEEIDTRWGLSPRQILQYFGTDDFQYNVPNAFPGFKEKIGRNFWVKKFEVELLKHRNANWTITDFRFPHEAEVLKSYDAITVKIVNPNVNAVDLHESEAYVRDMECDYYIDNNGTKEDLYKKIDTLLSFNNFKRT